MADATMRRALILTVAIVIAACVVMIAMIVLPRGHPTRR
jgi:hypothetical protein